MKKLKSIVAIFATIILTSFLQSCLGDDNHPSNSLVISTINVINPESREFYFTLDDGQKMFPNNAGELHNYKLIDGQRAFVIFEQLEQKINGYDYNINIKEIHDVLTKDIVTMGEGENTEEKIGDHKINATDMQMTKDLKYLTIEYQYFGTNNADKKHFLNLVINPLSAEPTADTNNEYFNLEFRHNNEGDIPDRLEEGYVSFKLEKIKELAKGKKGLRIRVNTIYNDIKYINVDFPS